MTFIPLCLVIFAGLFNSPVKKMSYVAQDASLNEYFEKGLDRRRGISGRIMIPRKVAEVILEELSVDHGSGG